MQYNKSRRFHPLVRKIPWRRAWQPTPVFLPGKSHGQRSLAGYSPWGCKELDTTEYAHTYMSNVGLTTAIQQNSLVMTSTWLDADDTCFSLELSVLFEYLQKIIFLK